MDFDLRTPCKQCPFRTDIPGFLTGARMDEIIGCLFAGQTFTCHKTTTKDENGKIIDGPDAQHCAGALIFLEHNDQPNQLMRIAERLGVYDRTKLNMTACVPECEHELIDHHADSRKRRA